MFGAHRLSLISTFVVLMFFGVSAWPADAQNQNRSPFDLPAQPLAKALTNLALQVGLNIYFDDALVAGLQAPALKAELTADEAIARLLLGTTLKAVYVNPDTVRVTAEPGPTRAGNHGASQTGAVYTSATVRLAYAGTDPEATDTQGQTGSQSTEPESQQALGSMTPDQSKVEEVVVTGTRLRGVSPASSIVQIDRPSIERSGFATTSDVLGALSQNFAGALSPSSHYAGGANVLTNVGYASGVDLRGLGDSTLILVDGHRLALSGIAGSSDLSTIPLGVVERIDVLTDGASAIYGSDAIGGVVNVVLRRDFDGFETSGVVGDTARGGGQQERGEMTFGKSWDGGNVLLAYDYAHQDPITSQQRDFSQLAETPTDLAPLSHSNSVTANLRQRLSEAVSTYIEGIWTRRSTENAYNYYGYNLDDVHVDQFSATAGLAFQLPRGWSGSMDATVGGDIEHVSYVLAATAAGPFTSYPGDNDNRQQSLELQANGVLAMLPSGALNLATGAGHRHEQYADDFNVFHGVGRDISYAFSEAQLPVVPRNDQRVGLMRLELNAAVRYDHYSDAGGTTNPKVGVTYSPATPFTIRATWGTAFRAPLLSDEYGANPDFLRLRNDPTSQTGKSIVLEYAGGNPTLKPEKATIWTASLDFTPPQIPGLKATATYFNYRFKDKISTPVVDTAAELTDPAYAYVLTKNPSLGLIQQILSQGSSFRNTAGPNYSPADAEYLADLEYQNLV
jgi:iron complex outermembrane recepter protein